MQLIMRLLFGMITEEQIGAIAEEINRFVLRAWAAGWTAAVAWFIAWWRGASGGGNWLQASAEPAVNTGLEIGTIFAIISAIQYAIQFFRKKR